MPIYALPSVVSCSIESNQYTVLHWVLFQQGNYWNFNGGPPSMLSWALGMLPYKVGDHRNMQPTRMVHLDQLLRQDPTRESVTIHEVIYYA